MIFFSSLFLSFFHSHDFPFLSSSSPLYLQLIQLRPTKTQGDLDSQKETICQGKASLNVIVSYWFGFRVRLSLYLLVISIVLLCSEAHLLNIFSQHLFIISLLFVLVLFVVVIFSKDLSLCCMSHESSTRVCLLNMRGRECCRLLYIYMRKVIFIWFVSHLSSFRFNLLLKVNNIIRFGFKYGNKWFVRQGLGQYYCRLIAICQ